MAPAALVLALLIATMLVPAQPAQGAGYSVMLVPPDTDFSMAGSSMFAEPLVQTEGDNATDNATIWLEPVGSSFPNNEPFDVRVMATVNTEADTVGFEVDWSPDDQGTPNIRCTGIDFVTGAGSFFEGKDTLPIDGGFNPTTGTINQYALSSIGNDPVAAGTTGAVAVLHFDKGAPPGTYNLHLHDCQVAIAGDLIGVFITDVKVTVLAPAGPPAPSDLKTAIISPYNISLAWVDNSRSEKGFLLQRASKADLSDWQTRADNIAENATACVDYNLTPDTKYYYRVYAYNDIGLSSPSNVLEVSTHPLQPPSPTNLRIASRAAGEINLKWDDNAPNETGYRVERMQENRRTGWQTSSPWLRFYVPSDTTEYQDTGVAVKTAYFYRVVAYNAYGDSQPSNVLAVVTEDGIPQIPSSLKLDTVIGREVKLTWTDNSNNETGFIIERDKDSDFEVPTHFAVNTADTVSYIDTTPQSGKTYYYRVRAYNAFGQSEPSNYVKLDLPATPTALKAELTGYTQVDLSWNDNSRNARAYRIERALNAGFTSEKKSFYTTPKAVAAGSGTSKTVRYSDVSAGPGKTYYYRVITQYYDEKLSYWDSPASNTAMITTGTPPRPEDVKTPSVSIAKFVDENGITKKSIVITSLEGVKSLEIGEQNQLLTFDDKPLQTLEVSHVKSDTLRLLKSRVIALPQVIFKPGGNISLPPVSVTEEYSAQIIGPVVDFQPSGAHFFQPVTLTLQYDPADYPSDRAESDLVMAYYDAHADKWVELPTRVSVAGNTVSARISHLSTFGIIKKSERVMDYWRMIAIIASETVVALLLLLSLLLRKRSREYR